MEKSDPKKKNLLTLVLFILSLGYSCAVQWRLFLYKIGIFKTNKLPCKVISLGNITVGGTGKTPACLLVAAILQDAGEGVAILSRGYRGRAKKKVNVVSDGKKLLLNEELAGDEPFLMAKKLRTTPVLTSKNRFLGGTYACDNLGVGVVVLDDGFQHLGLKRDLNICLIDTGRGFGNDCLLPLGILREPIRGLRRADIFLINNNGGGSQNKNIISKKIAEFKHDPVIFEADYEPTCLREVGGKKKFAGNYLKGKKVCAFSGIANTESFVSILEKLGAIVIHMSSFPDHYRYSRKDLEKIKKMAGSTDFIVTTEKDGVKLGRDLLVPGLTVFALEIRMQIADNNINDFKESILSVL